MFAPKTRPNSSNRRDKPYARKPKPMERSSSLLGAIKNIVSAPLSWFASNPSDFEDLGKRRRVAARDASDVEEGQEERSGKRMRVDSPEPPPKRVLPSTAGGYLDPPPFSSHPDTQAREEKNVPSRRPSIFGRSFVSNSRTASVDPPSRYAALHRDPAMVPLPGSPLRSSPARSVGSEDGQERHRTPFRLRTSLTPQPSPTKPVRREASAPPPLSSLQARPVFVKPPRKEKKDSSPGVPKTMSLGMLAERSRDSRALSRDRTLTSLGRISSISDQIASSISSDAILQPSKSLSQKTFQELELYKTPILPSRYKDASAIPAFLKPKRSHVPIPMKKNRGSKPSLGMAEKVTKEKDEFITRDDGKPYARKGGIGTLLAKRRAEEEEEKEQKNAESTLTSVEEEDEMETDVEPVVVKRDIGVSARMTSGSEDERAKSRNVAATTKIVDIPAVPSSNLNDPFSRPSATTPGGRQQPYGRVGRTRTREPGQRSVPLSRPTNKFSATFEEGDSVDSVNQSMILDDATSIEAQQADTEKPRAPPAFEAPKGFTFAGDTSAINHDHTKAKEPPITALPFSFGAKPVAPAPAATDEPKETPSFKPPSSVFPTVQSFSKQTEKKDETVVPAPAVSVVPPTPDQPGKDAKGTTAPPNFFAIPSSTPASSSAPSSTAPKLSGMPNFFASSPLLAGNKAETPAPPKAPSPKPLVSPSGTTPATPVKDPENPLWNGNDAAPSAPPKLFAQAVKPFTFGAGAKSTDETSAPSAPSTAIMPSPLFGVQPKQPGPSATPDQQPSNALPPASTGGATVAAVSPSVAEGPQALPAPSKPSEFEKKANGSAPAPFSFGAGAASNVPKQLFGTGAPTATTSPFSVQPSQPSQSTTGDTAPKPTFSFGQPQAQVSDAETKSPSTQPSQPPQNGPTTTEQKSPFTFGAPSATSTASSTPGPVTNDVVAAPKPSFGAPTTGTGFTFGAPPSAPSTEAAKPPASPFAFGAPPATPPAGERQSSPFPFGAPAASGGPSGFTFGTPVKENGVPAGSAPSTPTNTSPFVFGAQPATQPARPVTPPSKPDDGMSMEESPVQMDTNGGQKKPMGSISFGLGPTPVNPFAQNTSSGSGFTFGAPATSNPFAPKSDNKPAAMDSGSGFNFNRTSSAPAISTSFSFGAKSDVSTPPATAFGAGPSNPFGQTQTSGTTSSPFTFGQQSSAPPAYPFGAPAQSAQPATGATPSSPFSSTPAFTFGAPPGAPNPFTFGSSAPSSPATGATGLPQASGASGSTPAFTFGQTGTTGSSLFNIGAPPPNTGQNTGTPRRAIKNLPRRGQAAKR